MTEIKTVRQSSNCQSS